MIPMLIVVGCLVLIMEVMLYYDAKGRRREEKYQPDIEGSQVENEFMSGSESDLARKQDLEFLRGYLEEFERRLILKLGMICVVAIGVSAAMAKYMR